MNPRLRRHSYDERAKEIRRLIAVGGILVLASISWHMMRPAVVRWTAHVSVGCLPRDTIVAAVLRNKHQSVPNDAGTRYTQGQQYPSKLLWTYSFPRPGWVLWESVRETVTLGNNTWLHKWRFKVADHGLQLRGTIGAQRNTVAAPVGDFDGDGQWEVVLEFQATPWQKAKDQYVERWAVVRLGDKGNEIVWIGLSDFLLWSKVQTRIKPVWQDEDGDGISELAFLTVKTKRLPNGRLGFDPPTTVAVFEWDSAGGILIPQSLPDDSGILSWSPPKNLAVRVDKDAEMEEILADLFPVPDGFGLQTTSQPAGSSPDTSGSP